MVVAPELMMDDDAAVFLKYLTFYPVPRLYSSSPGTPPATINQQPRTTKEMCPLIPPRAASHSDARLSLAASAIDSALDFIPL